MAEQVKNRQTVEEQRDALTGRLFQSFLGAGEAITVYIGDRLGFYKALEDGKAITPSGLAAQTNSHERYVREWLEQQAAAGILEVDNISAGPSGRRYRLPEGHADVLLNKDSLNYLAPLMRFIPATVGVMPNLLEAFQTGKGVPWESYDADGREAQADMNRPHYLQFLATHWLPAMPEVHARLQANPPARVADIACGAGWSSIAIARAYPNVQVDGFDLDAPSIEMARSNAGASGLGRRLNFHVRDASDPSLSGRYDLVTVFEALHDMSRPVEALRTMRGLVAPGGSVLVMDENVGEEFTAPSNELERFFYCASVLLCLPTGMAEQPSAGTGTVMRPATLRSYAQEAGFQGVEVLPIEHDFFRFYKLIV